MEITEQIKSIKGEIKKAETDLGRSEGRLENLYQRLKKEHGISSLEDAEELLGVQESEIKGLEAEIQNDFTKLRKEYEW